MFKNYTFIMILFVISSLSLHAQFTVGHQKSKDNTKTSSLKGNPDVIFKVIGTGESHEHLILDLPEGASYEHQGEGIFHITGMPDIYDSYKIELKAEGDILNGVTTADISLILRHIVGNAPLSNEYRMIAADVDCDGRVSVLDAIQIKRAILDRITEFGCKTNYKFWPENLEFVWEGSSVDAGVYNSIKLGDVNNSAIFNSGANYHGDH